MTPSFVFLAPAPALGFTLFPAKLLILPREGGVGGSDGVMGGGDRRGIVSFC